MSEPVSPATAPLTLVRATGGTFLERALAGLEAGLRAEVDRELIHLLNSAMVIDVEEFAELEQLRRSARDLHRYLGIGLEYLSGEAVERGTALLERVRLRRIVQVGFTLTVELRRRAERLLERPGLEALGPSFLGPPAEPVLGALRRDRPGYARVLDRAGDVGSRPFASLDDVRRVHEALAASEALATFLVDGVHLDPASWTEELLDRCVPGGLDELEARTVVATILARSILDGEARWEPIPAERLEELHRRAFPGGPRPLPGGPEIDAEAAAPFVAWVEEGAGSLDDEARGHLDRFLADCREIFSTQLGPLAPDGIEPFALPGLVVRIP